MGVGGRLSCVTRVGELWCASPHLVERHDLPAASEGAHEAALACVAEHDRALRAGWGGGRRRVWVSGAPGPAAAAAPSGYVAGAPRRCCARPSSKGARKKDSAAALTSAPHLVVVLVDQQLRGKGHLPRGSRRARVGSCSVRQHQQPPPGRGGALRGAPWQRATAFPCPPGLPYNHARPCPLPSHPLPQMPGPPHLQPQELGDGLVADQQLAAPAPVVLQRAPLQRGLDAAEYGVRVCVEQGWVGGWGARAGGAGEGSGGRREARCEGGDGADGAA